MIRARTSYSQDARGVALLFEHEAVLAAQCAAIARAAAKVGRDRVRVLIPLVRSQGDVDAIRARVPGVPVGAMIETREAALRAAEIAEASDFVSIGTNDLAASVLGARGDATRALDPKVLALVAEIVRATHARGKRVTVCGEVAADARGARVLAGIGVDGLSVFPPRMADVVLALRGVTRGECEGAAREAMGGGVRVPCPRLPVRLRERVLERVVEPRVTLLAEQREPRSHPLQALREHLPRASAEASTRALRDGVGELAEGRTEHGSSVHHDSPARSGGDSSLMATAGYRTIQSAPHGWYGQCSHNIP